jgi:peptide/nickel transport system permease protein
MTEALVTETATRAPELTRRPFRLGRNRSRALRPWYRITPLVVGLVLVVFLVLVAVLAPMIATHDPSQNSPHPTLGAHWWAPTRWAATSSRGWYSAPNRSAGRSLAVHPVRIGSVLGAVSGYFGGVIDAVIMRIVDVFAFPFMSW